MIKQIKKYFKRRKQNLWFWIQRMRLKNSEITIIANNCIGGIIYHDLGLQFQSPTINLDVSVEDFLTLCEHMKECLVLPIEPIESQEMCPVGIIRSPYGNIKINFRHYKSFEEGVKKWEERKKRIHWNNIFVIMEDQKCSVETASRFEQLPFVNKVLYSALKSPHSVLMPESFYGETYHWGKILEYPKGSIHRYIERLDYVAFFNKEGIKLRNYHIFKN